MLDPRFLSYLASYDTANIIRQARTAGLGSTETTAALMAGLSQAEVAEQNFSLACTSGGAVQVASIETRVERTPGFSASN
jgi:hypothetical protein